MMIRMQSAPRARDSTTWYGSKMKSLRKAGIAVAPRAAVRNSGRPWKEGASVKIGADQPLRRTCFLDFGNQRVVFAENPFFDCVQEAARRWRSLRIFLKCSERTRAFGSGNFLAFIRFDPGEDVRHARPPLRSTPQ